jgi:hypothetical protein
MVGAAFPASTIDDILDLESAFSRIQGMHNHQTGA